jgi:hypothetical protein
VKTIKGLLCAGRSPYDRVNMSPKTSQGIKFGCVKCGSPFEVYPPDSDHALLLMEPCKEGDSIPLTVTCEKCKTVNTRHWDTRHYFGAVG